MKESTIEARLVRGVRALGGRAYKFVSPGASGVPDRLVILPGGIVLFAELKTDAGEVSHIQRHRIAELRHLGVEADVVRGVEGVEIFLTKCRKALSEGRDAG